MLAGGPHGRVDMSTPPPNEAELGGALRALLAAAGLTPDRVLAGVGERRDLVSRTSLYDWMKNSHLPDDDRPVLEVVRLCLDAAERRGAPVDPELSDVQGWR